MAQTRPGTRIKSLVAVWVAGSKALEQGLEVPVQYCAPGKEPATFRLVGESGIEEGQSASQADVPLVQVSFDLGDRPILKAQVLTQGLTQPNPNQKTISFLIDSGADVTTISTAVWPSSWALEILPHSVSGVGGFVTGHRSHYPILFSWKDNGQERTAGPIRP